eukprot:TRINITY_DN5747_c0_g1_i2.p1 TRINITY_DN5747_c0_g1~~TRINITY_DN5747_c0_g1_i2.p1  ORF type:complete len:786 (+),score=226.18 TRINITY_DN5747_c0_g1_i2:26-2383(+)
MCIRDRFSGFDDERFQREYRETRESFEECVEDCLTLLQVAYAGSETEGPSFRMRAEFPINVLIYEQLLYVLYENGEGEEGEMVDEAGDVMEAYEQALWSALGIGEELHCLSHAMAEYSQFKRYRTPRFLVQMLDCLGEAVDRPENDTHDRDARVCQMYTKQVVTMLIDEVLAVLASAKADLEEFGWQPSDVLQVLKTYLRLMSVMPECILEREGEYSEDRERIVIMEYAAAQMFKVCKHQAKEDEEEVTDEHTLHDVAIVNTSVLVEILAENIDKYCKTDLFRSVSGGNEAAFVRIITGRINNYIEEKGVFFGGEDTQPLPQQFSVQNEELLHLLRKLQQLEESMHGIQGKSLGLGLGMNKWAQRMLDDFITVETAKLENQIIPRAFDDETWEHMRNASYSSSVQDVFQFLIGSIEHYYGVALPQCIWDSTRFELDCITPAVEVYCKNISEIVGFVDDPPNYPFKRTPKRGVEYLTDLKWYPIRTSEDSRDRCPCQGAKQFEYSEEEEQEQAQKLTCCLNNLQRALVLIPEMKSVVADKCNETVKLFPGDETLRQKAAQLTKTAFSEAERILQEELVYCTEMLARRAVFYDLATCFENLYRTPKAQHGPQLSLLETKFSCVVEDKLDDVLCLYHPRLDEELSPGFLQEVLEAIVVQMRRAILYGGPDRLFNAEDAKSVFEADMLCLRRYFEEGKDSEVGLEKPIVDEIVDEELGKLIFGFVEESTEDLENRFAMAEDVDAKALIAHILLHRAGNGAEKFYRNTSKKLYFTHETYRVFDREDEGSD